MCALALCVAVANYWVQTTAGGAARYALEFTFLAVGAAILFVLRRPAGAAIPDV